MTEWRAVVGYEGRYAVSDDGQVISTVFREPRLMKPVRSKNKAYWQYGLSAGGKTKSYYAHVLVALAFLGPRPEGQQVRHLNGEHTDNRVANLAWGTPKENSADTVAHGRHPTANKTHCTRGHEYTPENTRLEASRGIRRCRICRSDVERERRRRRDAEAGIDRSVPAWIRKWAERWEQEGPTQAWVAVRSDGDDAPTGDAVVRQES